MTRRVPADYMRGGTSKGLFFRRDDLPADIALRDRLLLRAIGSPDPYARHIDGMGGATSSTSKVVLVARSEAPDADVDYLFGAVAIGEPLIDWSGNCGNLTTAVGPFAIRHGLVAAIEPVTAVRLRNLNRDERIVARVPVRDGEPLETGEFVLDGVAFPGAPIELAFEGDPSRAPLPTGRAIDRLPLPEGGEIEATLVDAGNPAVFVRAVDVGLTGIEHRDDVDRDAALLLRLEGLRAQAAVRMNLAPDPATATRERPATPKIAFVAPPRSYVASSGRAIDATSIDLVARILSMGSLHHAFTGTGAIALAVAAALPGTVVADTVGGPRQSVDVGHPSGTLRVGAVVTNTAESARVVRATVVRSARLLMSGLVSIPDVS